MSSLKLKPLTRAERGLQWESGRVGLFGYRLWQHFFQDDFQGHSMATTVPADKEITVALPLPIFKYDGVRVVLARKVYF